MSFDYKQTHKYTSDDRCSLCEGNFHPLQDRVYSYNDEQVFYHGRCLVDLSNKDEVQIPSLIAEAILISEENQKIAETRKTNHRYQMASKGCLAVSGICVYSFYASATTNEYRDILIKIGLLFFAAAVYFRSLKG